MSEVIVPSKQHPCKHCEKLSRRALKCTNTRRIRTSLRADPDDIPDASSPSPRRAWVYMAHSLDDTSYKIGFTTNLERRLRELTYSWSRNVVYKWTIATDTPRAVEKYWHQRFSKSNIEGEFFSLTWEQRKEFASISAMDIA